MATIFRYDGAKQVLEASYERFRARVPDAQGRTVTTRFGETHVLVAGRADAPPLVLLHGALTGSAHMMSVCGPLLDHFRIYAPDILGHSVKSADARLPDYAGSGCGEWLVDVMDALGLERAHVCGASLGGFLARKLAEHAPERVDRLVLLVPAGIHTNARWPTLTTFMIPMFLYRAFPTEKRLRGFMDTMLTTYDAEWDAAMAESFRGFKQDLRMPPLATPEEAARYTGPTLVVGASDDIFFPGAELIARAKVLFPHAETELLEGCRHMLPTNDAFIEQNCARVGRFLRAA